MKRDISANVDFVRIKKWKKNSCTKLAWRHLPHQWNINLRSGKTGIKQILIFWLFKLIFFYQFLLRLYAVRTKSQYTDTSSEDKGTIEISISVAIASIGCTSETEHDLWTHSFGKIVR